MNKILTDQQMLVILIFLGICTSLSIDIHLASLPIIMEVFHTDKVHMQQSVTLFVLGLGVSLLIYGPLSDKVGRRPVVILGLSIALIGCLAILVAPTIFLFLLCRLIQGIGAGVCIGLGRTMLADLWQGYQLTVKSAYFALALSLSPLLAPALGGYIQHWFDWKGNFVFLTVFFAISLFLFYFFFPETNKHLNPLAFSRRTMFYNYRMLFLHKRFMGATVLAGLVIAANLSFATKSAFIIQQEYGISPVLYGWLMCLISIGGLISRGLGPYLLKKLNASALLFYSIIILFGSGLAILVLYWLQVLTLTRLLFLVGCVVFVQGLVMPLLLSVSLGSFHEKRGAASALYGSIQMLIGFVGSVLVSSAHGSGELNLSVGYICFGLCAFFTYWGTLYGKLEKTSNL